MIDLGTRVHVPHKGLYGKVIRRHPIPNRGIIYTILIETNDGSYCQALYGAASINIAVNPNPGNAAEVVSIPRGRPALRLAALHGIAL